MNKEEKDKLIALSDLNREDNIKYISSEAQGIAIALDSDRYAPTFCKLERAYICGRRKSEEQIADLEKDIELLKNGETLKELQAEVFRLTKDCDETQELLDKQIEATYKLVEENEGLKARLNAINLLTPELEKQSKAKKKQLIEARELILKLYNAGRDVLMCRADEKAYDNLSEAIDDKGIEQFLSEVEK